MRDTPDIFPDDGNFLLVYVTAPDKAVADRIARTVVEERLAACANLLEGMHSVYRWQGSIEEAREVACLFKTTADRREDLFARVRELHPYEVPCIVALPIYAGSASFLEWLTAETRP